MPLPPSVPLPPLAATGRKARAAACISAVVGGRGGATTPTWLPRTATLDLAADGGGFCGGGGAGGFCVGGGTGGGAGGGGAAGVVLRACACTGGGGACTGGGGACTGGAPPPPLPLPLLLPLAAPGTAANAAAAMVLRYSASSMVLLGSC